MRDGGPVGNAPRTEAPGSPDRGPLPDLIALGLIFAVGLLVHRHLIFRSWTGFDEDVYLRAFQRIREGVSPYGDRLFLYPPAFAVVGAALEDRLGEHLSIILRLANLLGASLLVWLSLARSSWRAPFRVGLAVVAIGLSPLIRHGLWYGNVSQLFVGLSILGLVGAWSRPTLGGATLGVSNALKPLTAPALAIVAAQGLRRSGRGWELRTALTGVLAALCLTAVGARYLPDMMTNLGGRPEWGFNVSLHRTLFCFGLEIPALAIFLGITAVACGLVWWNPLKPRPTLVLATSASLLALPVVNPSTLVLSYPAQIVALERVWRRASAKSWDRRLVSLAEVALVPAAILGIHGGTGVSAATGLPLWIRGLVTLIPLLAVTGLTVYALIPDFGHPGPEHPTSSVEKRAR